ncbi:MAG: diguanylate cyclase [Syntrophomonas sp.]|nr:diguanylate cyclase [Syntrophomonas sp.]
MVKDMEYLFDDIPPKHSMESLYKENISLRERLATIASRSKIPHFLKDYFKSLNIIFFSTDLDLQPHHAIGEIQAITGYKLQDFIDGMIRIEHLIHPEDLQAFMESYQYMLDTHKTQNIEFRIISTQGLIRWLNVIAVPITNESEQIVSVEGLVIDITSRKKNEAALIGREAHLDSILRSVQDVIWSITPDTFELIYISPAAKSVYGYPLEQIYADSINGFKLMNTPHQMMLDNFSTLLDQGSIEFEYPFLHPSGEKIWISRKAHFAHDGQGYVARIDGTDTDITRRRQAEDTLRYISMHDYLTGLYNRFYFEKEMFAIDDAVLDSVGLIVCDVDGLKTINDNFGHTAGDQLLKQCASVLICCFTHNEIISRIGGDEFTILIRGCSAGRLEKLVRNLRITIFKQNQSQSSEYPLSISIGHALKSSPEIKMSDVFRHADNMMYAEKPNNRQRLKKLYRTLKL